MSLGIEVIGRIDLSRELRNKTMLTSMLKNAMSSLTSGKHDDNEK